MNVEEAERLRERDDVKSYCNRLLRTADVKDVYPTPVDRIVEAAELVKSGDLTLLEIKEEVFLQRMWKRLKVSLSDLVSVIRGGLFPTEKTIFINPNTPSASVPFVTLHECTHHILPWQQKTLIYLDNDKTLDSQTRYRFEREANFGGSFLLWQGEDYIQKSLDMPITTATPVFLANLFGGSIHSSMRYYVENHKAPLYLLVFRSKGITADLSGRYHLQYSIASEDFKNRFGCQPFSLSRTDRTVLFERSNNFDLDWSGEILLSVENVPVRFDFFGYETPYNVFIIMSLKNYTRRYGKPIVVFEKSAVNSILT